MSANDVQNNTEDRVDELFDGNTPTSTPEVPDADTDRDVNFVLDHTAFTKGIGNIKRWFNEDYVQTENSQKKPRLNLFIPTYTLHEFDYARRGLTMTASNAREAIAFIDQISEGIEKAPLEYEIHLGDEGISSQLTWDTCRKYQVHEPVIGEFPNYRTQYGSSKPGLYDEVIAYENSQSYQSAAAHAEEPAQMPARLRYIITPCLGIRDKKTKWVLVTEDDITRIWARSFGIECMNVTEAELMLFKGYDVNNIRQFDPNRTIIDQSGPNSILQETIDTTVYPYQLTSSSRPKKAQKAKKNDKKLAPKTIVGATTDEEGIKKERFDAINHAPRGSGKLWRPAQ